MKTLFDTFGNPQENFKSIHIAGTNGKGSVSSLIASMLFESNFKTGLYTSPHLLRFNERIKVNGEEISDEALEKYSSEMLHEIEQQNRTFFEGTTAIAFRFFNEQKIDFAVVETGLGGRLDATNIISPQVSVITTIGLDHEQYLGDTLEEIAFEKAGIIKPQKPVVVGFVEQKLREVFAQKAIETNSDIYFVEDIFQVEILKQNLNGYTLNLTPKIHSDIFPKLTNIHLPLLGLHQIQNLQTAIAAVSILGKDNLNKINFELGIANVIKNTKLCSRFEFKKISDKLLILDVAHNAQGALQLVSGLKTILPGSKFDFIYGSVRDKNYPEILKIISPIAQNLFAVKANNKRSEEAETICNVAQDMGLQSQVKSIAEAIQQTLNSLNKITVIFGSFYVVAEALEIISKLEQQS